MRTGGSKRDDRRLNDIKEGNREGGARRKEEVETGRKGGRKRRFYKLS